MVRVSRGLRLGAVSLLVLGVLLGAMPSPAQQGQLRITITSPTNHANVQGFRQQITGRVRLVVDGQAMASNVLIGYVKTHGLVFFPFVMPATPAQWWTQPILHLNTDGTFKGLVYCGNVTVGMNMDFTIVVLAIQPSKVRVAEGKVFGSLPPHQAASPQVTVRRTE